MNLSKKGFTILLNIQILSFLKPALLEKYIIFLEENLNNEKEINLFKYFKSYWIDKKGFGFINYYEYIKHVNNFICLKEEQVVKDSYWQLKIFWKTQN